MQASSIISSFSIIPPCNAFKDLPPPAQDAGQGLRIVQQAIPERYDGQGLGQAPTLERGLTTLAGVDSFNKMVSPSGETRSVRPADQVSLDIIAAIQAYTEKILSLRGLADQARLVEEPSERCSALKLVAEAYLQYFQALDPLHLPSCLKEKLSTSLSAILEAELLPLYCQGYIEVAWFRAYAAHLRSILGLEARALLLGSLVKKCAEHYYLSKIHIPPASGKEREAFEIKLERLIEEQLQVLIAFLEGEVGNEQAQCSRIHIRLSRIEELLQELYWAHPGNLGLEALAELSVFLIRHGSLSAIEGFLRAYVERYADRKKTYFWVLISKPMDMPLESALSLAMGGKRFFSLSQVHVLKIIPLVEKDSWLPRPMVHLYFEALNYFQKACKSCLKSIEAAIEAAIKGEEAEKSKNKNQSFSSNDLESHSAVLVACLKTILELVDAWSEEVFDRLGTLGEDFRIKGVRLKADISEASERNLRSLASYYWRSYVSGCQPAYKDIEKFLQQRKERSSP